VYGNNQRMLLYKKYISCRHLNLGGRKPPSIRRQQAVYSQFAPLKYRASWYPVLPAKLLAAIY